MAARTFTADYAERVTLDDGTQVLLRLVTPDDKGILRHGFERWSQESRYARFFTVKERLTDDELRYLCDVDQETHFALGALREPAEGDDGEPVGLGIARFIRLPADPNDPAAPVTAEAAVAVADEVHGHGLGRILLERLVAAAEERGIERFRSEVLSSNSAMARLIEGVAPERKTVVSEGVMSIDFDLPHAVTEPETRESAMYRFFRGIAKMGPWGLIASRWLQPQQSEQSSSED